MESDLSGIPREYVDFLKICDPRYLKNLHQYMNGEIDAIDLNGLETDVQEDIHLAADVAIMLLEKGTAKARETTWRAHPKKTIVAADLDVPHDSNGSKLASLEAAVH